MISQISQGRPLRRVCGYGMSTSSEVCSKAAAAGIVPSSSRTILLALQSLLPSKLGSSHPHPTVNLELYHILRVSLVGHCVCVCMSVYVSGKRSIGSLDELKTAIVSSILSHNF